MLTTPAAACDLTATASNTLGTYSPSAVKAGAVPALQSKAGLNCNTALLSLLGTSSIKAKFTSQNGLKLLRSDGKSIVYTASADPGGTVAFAQNTTVDYMQNNLLNLLGLLGGSSADLPFFIKPNEPTYPPVGTYTDKITINWTWNLCPGGVFVLGVCVGDRDSGTGASVIDVTLNVTAQNATISLSTKTSWDPVNAASNPKALPGGKGLVSMTVQNPDIVPLDTGPVVLILPKPANSIFALDGDGTSATAIKLTDGTTPSTLTLSYTGPTSMSDNVDFSSDGGATWGYMPVAGDVLSERAITHIRFRAQGTMAKQSSFAISVAYLIQ